MSDFGHHSSHYFQVGGGKIPKYVVGKFLLPPIKISSKCTSNFSIGNSYGNNSLYGFKSLAENY